MAFDSPEAKQLNKDIFECIYYNALVTSCALAKEFGEHSAIDPFPLRSMQLALVFVHIAHSLIGSSVCYGHFSLCNLVRCWHDQA